MDATCSPLSLPKALILYRHDSHDNTKYEYGATATQRVSHVDEAQSNTDLRRNGRESVQSQAPEVSDHAGRDRGRGFRSSGRGRQRGTSARQGSSDREWIAGSCTVSRIAFSGEASWCDG